MFFILKWPYYINSDYSKIWIIIYRKISAFKNPDMVGLRQQFGKRAPAETHLHYKQICSNEVFPSTARKAMIWPTWNSCSARCSVSDTFLHFRSVCKSYYILMNKLNISSAFLDCLVTWWYIKYPLKIIVYERRKPWTMRLALCISYMVFSRAHFLTCLEPRTFCTLLFLVRMGYSACPR